MPLLLSLVWGGSVFNWTSWQILVAMGVAMASLLAFIATERRVADPILSLDLFQNRTFVTSVCAMFFTAVAMFGAIIYIPIFSQGVVGGSATHAGLVLTPMMLSLVIASAVSGQVISRTGRYKWLAIAGNCIIVAALFFFSSIGTQTSNAELMGRMVLLGIGLGSTMPIFTLAVQSAFGKERLGEVTAGSQLFRSIGGTVGTAVLGGVMNYRLAQHAPDLQRQPFVAQLRSLPAAQGVNLFDPSQIQSVLNPEHQQHLRALIATLPAGTRQTATAQFEHFLAMAKTVYSGATDSVFITAACLAIVAFVAVFFLPEIPLRKASRPAAEEAGVLLEDELAQDDPSSRRYNPNSGRSLFPPAVVPATRAQGQGDKPEKGEED